MEENEAKEPKKWTLMFFFASDNNLSPSMLYQLKSIKAAGYQPNTNVLVHFDPHERGVPSMIFDINKTEKEGQEKSKICDCKDPIIRNLAGDHVELKITEEPTESSTKKTTESSTKKTTESSTNLDNEDAVEALTNFLRGCAENYPAENYMLFLVGHGLVVGRDAFLPDENPNSGISLVELGKILDGFKKARKNKGVLQLIGMHSCSMSAVEVAYQLKGKAKYMMASEGLSFVGAWPYRQMLQKIFFAIDEAKQKETQLEVPELVMKLHELCVQNSADFIFAGYSSDLCLCSLDPASVQALKTPIQKLTKSLQRGLKGKVGRRLIQLAHLKSQSYFQEAYTDLYDFCLCLKESCTDPGNRIQQAMKRACESVISVLTPGNGPIIQSDFFGPDCQHSYGLSIYFPWVTPTEDGSEHPIKNYKKYGFVTALQDSSWLKFLKSYFEETLRDPRKVKFDRNTEYDQEAAMKYARSRFKAIGYGAGPPEYASGMLTGKVNPSDAGGFWTPSYIKNYSREFSISERALRVFAQERGQAKAKTGRRPSRRRKKT